MNRVAKNGLLLGALLLTVACGNTSTVPVVTTTATPTTVTPTTATPTTAKPTTATPTTAKPTTQTPTSVVPGECTHANVRVGVLSATSLTKGERVTVCNDCGHETREEIAMDATNVGTLASSGEDNEVNNMDIVRGLYGDCQVKFTYNNKSDTTQGDWAQGRTILVLEDEGKYVPGQLSYYGKGLAAPLNCAGFHYNNDLVYHHGWSGDSGVPTWFPGTYTDHSSNMDVEVTVTRLDEFVVIRTIGICKNHTDCKNENHFTYRVPTERALNIVLGTTFAEVTLKSATLDLTVNSSEETLAAPITVNPTSTNPDGTIEQKVHTHNFEDTYNQKVTFSFHESNSVNKDDNQWGHWRAWLWRTDKGVYPGDDAYNGTVYTRFTPTNDHYTDWNGCVPKWNLQEGVNGAKAAGAFSWFTSTDPNFVDNFGNLMDDVDVKLTFVKIDRYVFMSVHYTSNVYENTTAYRYYAAIVESNIPAAFTLCNEESTITLNSVKVEKF